MTKNIGKYKDEKNYLHVVSNLYVNWLMSGLWKMRNQSLFVRKKLDIGWAFSLGISSEGGGGVHWDLVNWVGFDLWIHSPCPFVGSISSGPFTGSVLPGPPRQVSPGPSCGVYNITSVLSGQSRYVGSVRADWPMPPGPCGGS